MDKTMINQINSTWFELSRIKTALYWTFVFVLVLSIYTIHSNSAFAAGSVPPNAVEIYPGLDHRLIGIPIIEKENTAALISYSQALDELKALETLSVTLNNDLAALGPESIAAKANAKERKEQFQEISKSYRSLLVSQYQDLSTNQHGDQGSNEPDELRKNQQTQSVSSSMRSWKIKAEKKMKEAEKHSKKVDSKIEESKTKLAQLDTDLKTAKKTANARKKAVRNAIPVALIESLEIPVLTMDAYLRSEQVLAASKPECGITWWALAGIGRAESNHGRFRGSTLDQSGTVLPPIIGVALDGNGFASIPDSDGGLLDGDTTWDRAVGVMQFIPGTWKGYGEDGNGDGKIDPQNVYDSALAAGKLLCANARPDMRTPEGRRTAYLRYNNSGKYADFVEAKGKSYEEIGAGRFNPVPVPGG